jgi:hypothetical protein
LPISRCLETPGDHNPDNADDTILFIEHDLEQDQNTKLLHMLLSKHHVLIFFLSD